MERRAKVELFEQIRREYEFGVGTIKGGGAQAGGASPDGAPGAGECGATGAGTKPAGATGNRTTACIHQCHPGGRPQGSAQATSHGTSYLRTDQNRDA